MSTTVQLPVLGGPQPANTEPVGLNEAKPGEALRIWMLEATKMWRVENNCYACRVPTSFFSSEPLPEGPIEGMVLENSLILGPPETRGSSTIARWGRGRYVVWMTGDAGEALVYFSTSDNTDPRTNGRCYSVVNQGLSFANDWDRVSVRRWLNHSRGRYFLRRGGAAIPSPLFANLGITDICNLKCSICGSQNMLQPVNRRHMDFAVFSMVADTLFPLLVTVELNSRGEPMIHPQFAEILETIDDYGIFLRLQTNGTQLQARKLQLLSRMKGELSVSLDGCGEIFEYVRRGAKWATVDEGMRNLLRIRDPDRLAVHLFPTLSQATIGGARDLIEWGMEVGVDKIDFHLYDPIEEGREQVPTQRSLDELKLYASKLDAKHPLEIRVDYEVVKPGEAPMIEHPQQERYTNIPRPAGVPGAHPKHSCMAPVQLVDIDLDGGVCICCFNQTRKIGNALTVEAFADCWFGEEYEAIRRSLLRTSEMALWETCRECVQRYAHGE